MKPWRVLLAVSAIIVFASSCLQERDTPRYSVLVGPCQVLKSDDQVLLFVQLDKHENRADPLAEPTHVQVGEWQSIVRIDQTGAKAVGLIQSGDDATVNFNMNLGRFFGYQDRVYYFGNTREAAAFYQFDEQQGTLERVPQDREELLRNAAGLSNVKQSGVFERLTELSRESGWDDWLGEYRATSMRFTWEGTEYTIQSVGDAEHVTLVLHQESSDSSKSVEILQAQVRDENAVADQMP